LSYFFRHTVAQSF